MSVDLLGLPVLLEQPPEHSHPSYPHHFPRHTGVGGTLPLSGTAMTSFPAGFLVLANAGTRVDSHRFLDDKPIFNELANVLAWGEGFVRAIYHGV